MGVTRHEHIFVLVALLDKFVEKDFYFVGDFLQFMTGKELEVDEYLIVTTTTRMDFLTHIAQFARKQHLDLRMYIFYIVFDDELAPFTELVDISQLGE